MAASWQRGTVPHGIPVARTQCPHTLESPSRLLQEERGLQVWQFEGPEVTVWHVSWGNLTQERPPLWGAPQITPFLVSSLLDLLLFQALGKGLGA